MLATIETGYLAAYAIGQFVSGVIGDRIGARKLVAGGMFVAAITCAAFGRGTSAVLLLVAFTLNGFAQSTGWPGTTKAMAEWIGPRLAVRSWARGVPATKSAASLRPGSRRGCFTLRLAKCFHRAGALHRGGRCAGLPHLSPGPYAASEREARSSTGQPQGPPALRSCKSPYPCGATAAPISSSSSCATAFYFGSPITFTPRSDRRCQGGVPLDILRGGRGDRSGLDRHHLRSAGTRRPMVAAAVSLVGLAAALLLYARLAPTSSILQFTLMALVGALLSVLIPRLRRGGPRRRRAGGSGQGHWVRQWCRLGRRVLQGYVIVGIRRAFGWSAVFYIFVALALLSAAALSPTFRRARNAPSVDRLTPTGTCVTFHDHRKTPVKASYRDQSSTPREPNASG